MTVFKKVFFIIIFLFATFLNIAAQNEITNENTNLVRGIYKTVGDFFSNNPSIEEEFTVVSEPRNKAIWKGTFNVIPLKENGNPYKRIWGFCDGYKQYIFHEGQYFPIIEENGNYTFEGFEYTETSTIYGVSILGSGVGAYLGGAAGGALISLIDGGIKRNKSKNHRITFYIEPKYGRVVHPNYDENAIIILRENKQEKDNLINVTINENKLVGLKLNTFHIQNKFNTNEIDEICFEGTDECIEFTNDKIGRKYVLVSQSIDENKPQFIVIDEPKGKLKLKIIKTAQFRASKQKK